MMQVKRWLNIAVLILSGLVSQGQLLTTHLPIVIVNTGGTTIPDEPKIGGTMQIVSNTTGALNTSDGPFNDYDGNIGIETRGNSTQGFDKKSYTVQLRVDSNTAIESSLLGMAPDSEWVLHSMIIDKSLVRIPFCFYLSQRMGQYASNWRYVELILNGEYMGVYAVVEKIKQSPYRVDIAPKDSIDETGGFILRIDWEDGGGGFNSEYPSMAGNNLTLQYQYPKGSQMSNSQKAFLKGSINNFENALFADNFMNANGKRYSDLADIESFVDFLLINELSKNADGYKLSSYIHKNNDAIDGRWKAGPIWDFDQTYGLSTVCSTDDPCGWTFMENLAGCEDLTTMPLWYETMAADSMFARRLEQRWGEYRSSFLHLDSLYAWIDDHVNYLGDARVRNFSKWQIIGTSIWIEPEPLAETYDEEIANLKTWLKRRVEWMDANLPHIYDFSSVDNHVKIFPNPAYERATIIVEPGSSVTITDMNGKQVAGSASCMGSQYILNVQGLASGVYVVYVKTTGGVRAGKLVVC